MNKVGMPPPTTAPRGLYTFDIKVQGACPYDGDKMRSSALKIGDHDVVLIDSNKYRASYVLNDTKDAFQAGVDVYDPDLQKLTGITDGTAKSPTINTADMDVQTDICGTYRFVFWAIDDHRELDKAHRRKPALEVNKAYTIPSAANFAFHTFLGLKGSTRKAAQVAAQEQEEVWGWYWDTQTKQWKFVSSYKNWKWWDGTKWQKEDKVQVNKTAHQAIKALRRVACFSWVMHSLVGSDGSIVVFGDRTYVAATPNSPGIYKLPQNATVYYLSVLPPNDLSHLVCVLILNCTGGDESSDSKAMVDEIYNKGANFVGSVIGGELAANAAIAVSNKFWRYAAKGKYETYYYQNQPYVSWTLCSLPEALWRAVNEVFGGEGVPNWWESSVYGTAFGYSPYFRGGGYLAPARGGKDDNTLIRMGPNP